MKNLARFLGVSLTILGIAPALADDGAPLAGWTASVANRPPRDDGDAVDGDAPPPDDGVTDPIGDPPSDDPPPDDPPPC